MSKGHSSRLALASVFFSSQKNGVPKTSKEIFAWLPGWYMLVCDGSYPKISKQILGAKKIVRICRSNRRTQLSLRCEESKKHGCQRSADTHCKGE